MEKRINIETSVDSYLQSEVTEGAHYSPETYLMAAVLERSYRDLFLEDRNNIKLSIMWFKKELVYPDAITFEKCLEYLPLLEKHLLEIDHAVYVAVEHLNNPTRIKEERLRLKEKAAYRYKF